MCSCGLTLKFDPANKLFRVILDIDSGQQAAAYQGLFPSDR